MTVMDEALMEIVEGRRHLLAALDLLERQRDLREDAEELTHMVGTLAGMQTGWEHERDRWR